MADKKISQLTGASTPLAGTEVLPIVQSGSTVKVSSDDLTVKNVRSNATSGILQIAGPAAAATRTMTVPDANFTVARTDAAQNFTGNNTFDTNTLAIDATNDRVGVGLTNPVVKFHAQGVATAISGASKATILIDDTTAYAANVGGAITFRGKYNAAGDYVAGGYIQAQKTNATDGNDSFDVVLGTRENGSGAAEALRLTDARDVKVTAGNLIQGTAAKGVNFTANTPAAGMTSQLLNWYEEGTWTPTIIGSTTDPTYTTSKATGIYTRVGRVVYIEFIIVVTGVTGQGTGGIGLAGLPFDPNASWNTTGYSENISIVYNDVWDVNVRNGYARSGSRIYFATNAVTQTDYTYATAVLSTGYFSGSGFYAI
jgi:hypothetical protein